MFVFSLSATLASACNKYVESQLCELMSVDRSCWGNLAVINGLQCVDEETLLSIVFSAVLISHFNLLFYSQFYQHQFVNWHFANHDDDVASWLVLSGVFSLNIYTIRLFGICVIAGMNHCRSNIISLFSECFYCSILQPRGSIVIHTVESDRWSPYCEMVFVRHSC